MIWYSDQNYKCRLPLINIFHTYRGIERGFSGANHHRAMKMVLSATLTRDPAKISQIKLCYPMFISGSAEDKRYQLPSQLQSYKLVLLFIFVMSHSPLWLLKNF